MIRFKPKWLYIYIYALKSKISNLLYLCYSNLSDAQVQLLFKSRKFKAEVAVQQKKETNLFFLCFLVVFLKYEEDRGNKLGTQQIKGEKIEERAKSRNRKWGILKETTVEMKRAESFELCRQKAKTGTFENAFKYESLRTATINAHMPSKMH